MLHSQKETLNNEVMTFQFAESQNQVRTLIENGNVYFVGSDVAKTLGYRNPRKALKDHCKGVTKRYILTKGGRQKMNVISEGDVFRLIIHSELESAQKFESWVMDEVLPTLRKKGYYSMNRTSVNKDYIDARNIPYGNVFINDIPVRMIVVDEVEYYSVNDYHRATNSSTGANQSAKKLNALETLAVKIWLFGNTNPAWFTKRKGLELLASSSRTMKFNQLSLEV
ncbi:MAG TPA: BRO family protein [Flavobacteriaceae bacterium]|nr:BRO family protein [Flavobacteriaceae bacterium]